MRNIVFRRSNELTYPLTTATGIFKRKKPISVTFADGTHVNAGTWKKVAETILKKCSSIPFYHKQLKDLCGKISGRERIFLADKPDCMRSPLKIGEELYIETHYDTETLLRIITTRILNVIQYDYSKITITIRNDD